MLKGDFKYEIKKQNFDLLGKIRLKLLVAVSVTVLAMFATQLVFANYLATGGNKISQIEAQIKEQEAQNTQLKVQIAQESSLASLSQKAKDLGFERPSKVIDR